jgi:hypothetical protein
MAAKYCACAIQGLAIDDTEVTSSRIRLDPKMGWRMLFRKDFDLNVLKPLYQEKHMIWVRIARALCFKQSGDVHFIQK